jgi:hypothetical protein
VAALTWQKDMDRGVQIGLLDATGDFSDQVSGQSVAATWSIEGRPPFPVRFAQGPN